MKLVIDSNRVMAALIQNSLSREILLTPKFEFVAPEKLREELIKNNNLLLKKSGLTKENFSLLLDLILSEIEIIPYEEIDNYNKITKDLIKDKGDVPFLSCALATNADGIWTEDGDFLYQNKVKVFKTEDLKKFL
mgnify:CR=1 FL=1